MRLPIALLVLLLAACSDLWPTDSRIRLEDLEASIGALSVAALEQRRTAIVGELAGLAHFSMNSGIGRVGYRSMAGSDCTEPAWVQIDFRERVSFDQVVLVPTIWRDADRGFVGDGFPIAFVIAAGDGDQSWIIREVLLPEELAARTAPFVIDCPGTQASWVRLTATQLSRRRFDGLCSLHLAEFMVFDEGRNIAVGQTVRTSSNSIAGPGSWRSEALVDSFVPYLMDAARGEGTLAFTNATDIEVTPTITIDLGDRVKLEDLVLHVVEQNDTVPQAFAGDYGVPLRFVLQGSDDASFREPQTLLEFTRTSIFDIAPIMVLPLKPAWCRFVRFTIHEPYMMAGINEQGESFYSPRVGFAEIELLSDGNNMAKGRPVFLNFDQGTLLRRPLVMTDGSNLYGEVLALRDWMSQLAFRYDLENELPLIQAELSRRYRFQSLLLTRLKWALVIAVVVVMLLVFLGLYIQQRSAFRLRHRITADLHDELGANVSAMVLLSELAADPRNSPEHVARLVERIGALSIRTRGAIKYCVDILATPGLYENLPEEMQRVSRRMLADLNHTFQFDGAKDLPRVRQRQRIELFLFYKECLVNILRHSSATQVQTRVKVDTSRDLVQLSVQDNGRGLPGGDRPQVPSSLLRRSRLMGARVSASRPADGGCLIELILPLRFRISRLALQVFPRSEE